ncbi:hypothetical protein [Haloechinothrix salitolerans]|uniref:YjbR protein n=1 Tax=Haloechinothrix salitolerans TaxID=926830 RepID=A0ABW2C8Q3_9PSEU
MAFDLPAGLTHPYDAGREAGFTYRHGLTFIWVRGDSYVSVQRGRVANARHVKVFTDAHPGHDVLTDRRPVVDVIPAPSTDQWRDSGVLVELADRWLASQRAQPRRSA